jgi:hypothetical protein
MEMLALSEKKQDWRQARMMAHMANLRRQSKTDKKYQPKDFMPKYDKPQKSTRRMSPEEMLDAVKHLCK